MIKEMSDAELIMILASILCDQTPGSVDGHYRYTNGSYKLSIRNGTVELTNILTNAKAVVAKAP